METKLNIKEVAEACSCKIDEDCTFDQPFKRYTATEIITNALIEITQPLLERVGELEMQWNLQKPRDWYVQELSFRNQRVEELEGLLNAFAKPTGETPLTNEVAIWKPRPSGSQSNAMLEAKAACSNIEKLLRSELKQMLEQANAAQDMVNIQQQQLTTLQAKVKEMKEKGDRISKLGEMAVRRWYHGEKDTLFDSHDISEKMEQAITNWRNVTKDL